jgi:hypothetical protein
MIDFNREIQYFFERQYTFERNLTNAQRAYDRQALEDNRTDAQIERDAFDAARERKMRLARNPDSYDPLVWAGVEAARMREKK